MQENYLHYIWQFQYFDKKELVTCQGDPLMILYPGTRNEHAGPDFLNSSILINDITWHGHVELHVKSSDWKLHKHQLDLAYNNVILHVVWEYDQPIERKDHTLLPTLKLQGRANPTLWQQYERLMHSQYTIPCAGQFQQVDQITKTSMLDKALFQRLTYKNNLVYQLLANNQGDWEATAYHLLAYNFGFKVNSQAFLELSLSLPWKTITKHSEIITQLEALLLGQAGLLTKSLKQDDDYLHQLTQEYDYLKHKYQLITDKINKSHWKFFRLRPANFPTIRIAQFAQLLHRQPQLFNLLIHSSVKDLIKQLDIIQSVYWQQHYQFASPSKAKIPGLGKASIDNVLINTVVPLLVAYGKSQDEQTYIDKAIDILQSLPAEHNKITRYWQKLGMSVNHAFDSQALIELFNNFCTKKKCLSCNIGIKLLEQHSDKT
jgi:hypothetical protein